MTLKFKDVPKMLPLNEAFKHMVRYDPYRMVSNNFTRGQYNQIAKTLKRRNEIRRATAVPVTLLAKGIDYNLVYNEMLKRGALREFLFCASVARSLAREFHDELPEGLEKLAQSYDGDPGAMADLAPYYKEEFKHFYGVYRRYGSRTTSA
ncbi:MAG: hypothetical protein Q8R00_01475 [Candidatus Nanoarchaeia archaeon]|nr:hypothetical protein [Candidatus Nanoarchaeia archaeon]